MAKKILFIDPVAGASGDMFLGALVDLGVDFQELRNGLKSLNLKGFDLVSTPVKRHTIAATKVDVIVEDIPHPHRHVGDLTAIIEEANLPEKVKTNACHVLRHLAVAESQCHDMPVEQVHLHEVGGLDCLVDVVGTCLGIELLQIDEIYSGPVSLGTGTVDCAHGRMPLPAPGTLAILKNFPVRKTNFTGEMTTPTGAAIIATLAKPQVEPIFMKPLAIGYGAGTKDKEQIANMLRLVLAESIAPSSLAHHHHHHQDHHDHHHGDDNGHLHHHHHEEKVAKKG